MADWIEVNGVSLRYDLAQRAWPTLVLLHEMGGTLETWDVIVPQFPQGSTLRYDMRGAGLSEKVRDVTLDDLVEDLRQLLDALQLSEPFVIAGVAVGAAVAVQFAARYPARVAALLLIAPATGISADRRDAAEALIAQIESRGLRERVVSRLPATFPEQFRGADGRLRSSLGRALANDPLSYGAHYRMLLDLDLSHDLSAVTCPTTVLAGTQDGTRPPDRVAQDAARIPGARFEAVDSGHVMPMLTPDLVVKHLGLLLNQTRGRILARA